MDKSEIKDMVKEVVKEIYQKERPPEDPIEFLASLVQSAAGQDPRLKDPTVAQRLARASLNRCIDAFKNSIRSFMGKDAKGLFSSSDYYTKEMGKLVNFIGLWASNILKADPTKKDEVIRILQDVRNHSIQATNQGRAAFDNMEQWGNYINARKQIEHAKEIFTSLGESIDELFELSKRYQYEE